MKKASIIAYIIAGLYLINAIMNLRYVGGIGTIASLFSVLIQFLIAFTMFRDKTDRFTYIALIVFIVTSINIPVIILLVLAVLCIFNIKPELVKKLWFAPAVAQTISSIFSIINMLNNIDYLSGGRIIMNFVLIIANTVNYLIIGKWVLTKIELSSFKQFFKNKKVVVVDNKKQQQITYYTDLYNNGVITAEELEKKKVEIENAQIDVVNVGKTSGGFSFGTSGNGQKTPLGLIIAAISIIGLIISIIMSVVADINLLDALF